jgi:CheY-like chemotaxis protein
MGSAELLRQEIPTTGRAGTLLDGILNASQRAAELTGQLLAYSRKGQMLQVPTDLHRVLLDAVSLLRTSFATNIAVVTQLAATRSNAMADAAQLQSAVLNLLVNAVDAMPDGGTLSITTTNFNGQSADPPSEILLTVQDTGKGIEPDLLSKIFDPFFTTKPVGKGTGLGLAAVAGTIKAHRGRIEVESHVGVGTVFRISLPLLEGELPLVTTSEANRQQGEGEILLVEDDSMVSTAALSTLRSLGYRPTHVTDGQRAIDVVQADPRRFRLVILDLRMPGMSGEQTFDALRAIAPKLPVLIWSGYGAEQDVAGMLNRGAAGFVQKPYRVADLSRAIEKALGKDKASPADR